MSANNGVIRIGRKGIKKFAFGESDDGIFEVDIVCAWQQWIAIDEGFRPQESEDPDQIIRTPDMAAYHQAAVDFVKQLSGGKADDISTGETLDFLARLREQYDELADFFRPKSRQERASPATSEEGLAVRFSEELPPPTK